MFSRSAGIPLWAVFAACVLIAFSAGVIASCEVARRQRPDTVAQGRELQKVLDTMSGTLESVETRSRNLEKDVDRLHLQNSNQLKQLRAMGAELRSLQQYRATVQVGKVPSKEEVDQPISVTPELEFPIKLSESRGRFGLERAFLLKDFVLHPVGETTATQNQAFDLIVVETKLPDGTRVFTAEGYELDPTTEERLQALQVATSGKSKVTVAPPDPWMPKPYDVGVFVGVDTLGGDPAFAEGRFGWRPLSKVRVLNWLKVEGDVIYRRETVLDLRAKAGLHWEW